MLVVRSLRSLGLALALGTLTACSARVAPAEPGGGGPIGPPSAITVSVTPATARVAAGATATFDAAVIGTTDARVTWSVVESAGGQIDPGGRFTASTVPGGYHVRATSVAAPTRHGEAAVTVYAPVNVTISPRSATVVVGTAYTFRATVENATDPTVTWEVDPATGCGAVTSAGVYTAPEGVTTCAVVARSREDPTRSDRATVTTRTAPPPTVTHPAFLLDGTTLARLAGKAAANDPGWLAVKAECDALDGGTVSPPSGPVTDLPNLPTSGDYQGLDYLQYALDTGLCYQVEKQLGNAALRDKYGAKLVAIADALTDPAHQSSHNASSSALQLEDDGWSMRTYPMALLYAYDWGYELFSAAERAAIVAELDSFIDTWDRGWAYPVVSGGQITGAVLWYGPSGSGTGCAVVANGGGGSGATCTVTRTNGRVTAVNVTSPGSGYLGTGKTSPYFTVAGSSTIPYGGGGVPFSSGTFDSNYYAAYYAVKGLTAVLTADDNPRAPELWADWSSRVHGGIVQPWYAAYRVGGGWPEGFQNYGERAVQLMSLPAVAVNDVKGVDLVHAAAPYAFPLDALDYMLYATWPSLDLVYDEGHGYYSTTPPTGYAQGSFFKYLAGFGRRWNHPRAAQFHQFTKDVLAARATVESAAEDFLYWDASAPDAPYASLPLSYLAQGATQGAGHVFARSDWTRSAVWLGFNGGVYLDYGGQGEEKYGKGGLELVRGGKPLLVLASWLNRISAAGENAVWAHDWSDPRRRDLYNTFQVFHVGAAEDTNQLGNGPPRVGLTEDFGTARTAVTGFEDGGTYVLATSRWLEDQYRAWNAATGQCPVASWTRSILYLRPTSQVVVYDRTGTCEFSTATAIDQQLVFMTPAAPVGAAQSPAVAGTTRYDVTYGGTFMGSVISVLPAGAAPSVTNVDNLSGAWKIAFRPPTCSASGCTSPPASSLRWLTVLDVNTSAGAVANASSLTATGMTGVLLQSASSSTVALFNAGAAGSTVAGAVAYTIPAGVPTSHLLVELPPSARYTVTFDAATGAVAVSPDAAGPLATSARGVLAFRTDASGGVLP